MWNPASYDQHSQVQVGLAQEVIEQLDLTAVGSILDVGCGSGRVTAELAARCPGARVVGVDLAPEMVDFATRSYARPGLSFEVADAAALEFRQGFDLVCSFACLHWLSDPPTAVARMGRLLNPSGRLRVQLGGPGNMAFWLERVEALRSSPNWREAFADFKMPWTFLGLEPFRRALGDLKVERLELISRTGCLASRQAFKSWFEAGWRPYVERLTELELESFTDQLLGNHEGEIKVPMVRVDLSACAGC